MSNGDHIPERRIGMMEMKSDIAVLKSKMSTVESTLIHINEKLDKKFVLKAEFDPVRKLVYGVVSICGIALITALVAQVIKHT